MTKIRLVRTNDEYEAVKVAAQADGHNEFFPTHQMTNGEGKIVGYLSLGAAPLVMFWMDSKLPKFTSLTTINELENLAACSGLRTVVVPCTKESPFYPAMEKLGYHAIGDYTLFMKDL